MPRESGWGRTLVLIGILAVAGGALVFVPPMLAPTPVPSGTEEPSAHRFTPAPSPPPAPSITPGAYRSIDWALAPFPDPDFERATIIVFDQRLVAVGVARGAPAAWYSDDGSDWRQGALPTDDRNPDTQAVITAVAATDGAILAVGRDVNASGEGGEPFVYRSVDKAVSWAASPLPGADTVQDVLRLAANADYFISIAIDLAGERGISWWLSSDGQAWEPIQPTGLPDNLQAIDLAGAGGVFVGAGSDGDRPPRHPAAWLSSDGIDWQPSVWGIEEAGGFSLARASGAGYLLAGQTGPDERTLSQVGLPTVFVSPDGRQWSHATFADLPGAQVDTAALSRAGAVLAIARLSSGTELPTSTALRFWPVGTNESTESQLPLVGITVVALGDRFIVLGRCGAPDQQDCNGATIAIGTLRP